MYQNSTSERFVAIWGSLSRWCLICSSRARDAFLLAVITNPRTNDMKRTAYNYTTLEKHSVLPMIRRWTRWNSCFQTKTLHCFKLSRLFPCTVSSYRVCSQQTLTILKLRTHHIAFESHGRVAKNPGRRQMRQSPPPFFATGNHSMRFTPVAISPKVSAVRLCGCFVPLSEPNPGCKQVCKPLAGCCSSAIVLMEKKAARQ